ncbi:MAG: type IX secretion system membrane protein PorP/SprF [Cyclobacteriaceae bacterium]|nr:type IX secretion system membrane protein PorP/SprF [Cyclobacteriaceae bacterium]
MLIQHVTVRGQQQPHFTQYLFSGLVINPAYAGADEVLSATFIDRHQWLGLEGAPNTQTLALHALTKRKRVGLGLLVSRDEIGVHQNLSAQFSYAYHLPVSRQGILSFGLQGGVLHLRADYNKLVSNSAPDPRLAGYFLNEIYASVGTGIYFRNKKLELGFSTPELLPKASAINDSTTLNFKNLNAFAFARYHLDLSPAWVLEPGLLLKRYGNLPVSFENTWAITFKEVLTTGLTYRLRESVGLLMRAKLTAQFNMGYAYDYPLPANLRSFSPSHEIMLQYRFSYNQSGIKSPRL